MSFEEEEDGENTHDVWNGTGEAEGCDGGWGLVAKTDHDDRKDSPSRRHKVTSYAFEKPRKFFIK